MIKLLLDMGLSPHTADFLRTRGYDVVHLREQFLQSLPDPEIVRKAQVESRVIVTFDLDFSRILALQRLAAPSIILFRLEEFTTPQVNMQLVQLLSNHQETLMRGAIIVVDSRHIRIRALPVWGRDE